MDPGSRLSWSLASFPMPSATRVAVRRALVSLTESVLERAERQESLVAAVPATGGGAGLPRMAGYVSFALAHGPIQQNRRLPIAKTNLPLAACLRPRTQGALERLAESTLVSGKVL